MSTIENSFSGAKLREARRQKKLTIAELADRVGVSNAAAGHWESGKNKPKPEKIKKIALVLGISSYDLSQEEKPNDLINFLSEVDKEFLSLLVETWKIPPHEALRRALKDSLSMNLKEQKSKQPPETSDSDQQQGQEDDNQSH